MAVWHQQYYAVPTSAGAEKRGQLEFTRVVYYAFAHQIRDALHSFVGVYQAGRPQRSNS